MLYAILMFLAGIHFGIFVANYVEHRLTKPIPTYFIVSGIVLAVVAVVVFLVG